MKVLKLLFFILLITSGVVLGLSYLLSSPRFQVSTIIVSGNHQVSLNDISSLLAIPKGENIFKLQSSRVTKRLESHPWIQEAAIKRKLPDKILIMLRERKPLALLRVSLKEQYLIDKEGFVISKATEEEGRNLTRLVLHGLRIEPKEGNRLMDPILDEILQLAHVFKHFSPWGGREIEQIEWNAELGTIVKLKGLKTEIRLGRDRYQEKLIKSKLVSEYLETDQSIVYIDLNYKDKVIVKYH